MTNRNFIILVALIVALGGFLMGFDASVISGVNEFIEPYFGLTKLELGWGVASLTLTATLAMLLAGPLSDKYGRRFILKIAAILFAVSAVASALAPTFLFLVIARMIGGLGVGASLIIAPMYIAEISPPNMRGQMVSFNQLNIVIGISAAFFSNYLILKLGQPDAPAWAESLKIGEYNWRWMLGLEMIPAVLYFIGLFAVPRSPRWLAMKGEFDEALKVMKKAAGPEKAMAVLKEVRSAISSDKNKEQTPLGELFRPAMRMVLLIGIVVAVLQQITGINSVFFYAPMIFKQSGIGQDAAFSQAIFVGLINLVFTVIAILLIDKLGRKPLLGFGVAGIAIFMFILAAGFWSATYSLTDTSLANLPEFAEKSRLTGLVDQTFDSDISFKAALNEALGEELTNEYESELISAAIQMNPILVLIGVLGFVASFAVSIGPVMWVLFSELFPQKVRGLAISFVGLINSGVSFLVQLVFPWELATLGSAGTFALYGLFAVMGLIFILIYIPETKGKSLEELETLLVKE